MPRAPYRGLRGGVREACEPTAEGVGGLEEGVRVGEGDGGGVPRKVVAAEAARVGDGFIQRS